MKKHKSAVFITTMLMLSLTACQKEPTAVPPETSAISTAPESTEASATDVNVQSPDLLSDSASSADTGTSSGSDLPDASAHPTALSLSLRTTWLNETQDDAQLCNTRFDTISVSSQDREHFPALSETLQQNYSGKLAETSHKIHAQNSELSAKDYADHPDHFWGPYTSEVSLSVRRADSTAVSFLKQDIEFTGGAHPISFYSGASFDSQSGRQLALSDVVSDISALPAILESILKEKYPKVSFFDLKNDLKAAAAKETPDFSWTLDYQGITFYFSPYELAPYSDGLLTAMIPFSSYPELIEESYTQIPETYVLFFQPWQSLDYDLDQDGDMEKIMVSGNPDENGTITQLQIQIDQQQFDFDFYSFSLDPYLIHTRDGKNYLYVKSFAENDYESLYVYGLSKDTVTEAGNVNGTGFYGASVSGNSQVLELPSNPDHFMLSTRLYVLSTTSGDRTYQIGSDGMPDPKEAYYHVSYEPSLTSLRELSADIVDPDSGAIRETQVILPKGETFRLYRTDNETYMDMRLDDGRICRFFVNPTEWPQTVNDMDSFDCFDGMIFAG